MDALQFLSQLEQEYRQSGLHVSAGVLRFALEHLRSGNPACAISSLEDSKAFLVGQMQMGPYEANMYSRDLALLNVVQRMIEGGVHA